MEALALNGHNAGVTEIDGRPPGMRAVSHVEGKDAIDDEALFEQVRGGNSAAFDTLVERHMRRAFSVAYRLLGQREDAEDLMQDAFMVALQKMDTFESGRKFAPWFYRILVNRGLNSRKSRSLRHTDQIPDAVASNTVSPLRAAEQTELRERLREVLAELPPRQRAVVEFFELEGFSSIEIADILELSDGTVRWHLHQARHALRTALAPFARRAE